MEKLDILNREEFVDNLLNLMNSISNNQSSTCFAINGTWGCGKSFVLDMFQNRLECIQSEDTYTDKFFVIRYNCWKFDYYDEPLVAIVSTIMSAIEEKTKLFPDSENKKKILGTLKAAGLLLISIGTDAVKAKTGIDVQKACDAVIHGQAEGAAAYENEHSYDAYFSFNKILGELSKLLLEISEQYTVVFLVDELDRCIPEYAIKILERLHHLTEGQSNIVTILTIDKDQLVSSVQQIFGFQNPEKYLEKFIQFEIKLDRGVISEKITEKYADYIALFDKGSIQPNESIEECLQALFAGISIRKQEQFMKKIKITHQLLFPEPKDYAFMCMEVLITLMTSVYGSKSMISGSPINLNDFSNVFQAFSSQSAPPFSKFFADKFVEIPLEARAVPVGYGRTSVQYFVPQNLSLYGAILYMWCRINDERDHTPIYYDKGSEYKDLDASTANLISFKKTITMIT